MSYSFTQFSTLAKIYTTTAREPSIYEYVQLIKPKLVKMQKYEECHPTMNTPRPCNNLVDKIVVTNYQTDRPILSGAYSIIIFTPEDKFTNASWGRFHKLFCALSPTFEKLLIGLERTWRRAPNFNRAISMICAVLPTFMKSTPDPKNNVITQKFTSHIFRTLHSQIFIIYWTRCNHQIWVKLKN